MYWDLSQRQNLPAWLSLMLVLLVIASLVGVFVQRVFTNGLGWPPAARSVPQFFAGHLIMMGSVVLTYHQLLTMVFSGVVAGGLYLLFNRPRVGTAMRARLDNLELLQLYGGRPQFVAALRPGGGTG